MSYANIKVDSKALKELKGVLGYNTGQRAVNAAIVHCLQAAKRKNILKTLQKTEFWPDYDPIKLRRKDR